MPLLLLETGIFVTGAANSYDQFWSNVFEIFSPKFSLYGAFYILANGHKLLSFFSNVFEFNSRILKWRTPRPACRPYQTQIFSNHSYAAICHASFNVGLLLMTTCFFSANSVFAVPSWHQPSLWDFPVTGRIYQEKTCLNYKHWTLWLNLFP